MTTSNTQSWSPGSDPRLWKQRHHHTAHCKTYEYSTAAASPGAEGEQRQLTVCGCQAPVREAAPVGQDGGEGVANENLVPLHGLENLRDHGHGDCSENYVSSQHHPGWYTFHHEDLAATGVVDVNRVQCLCQRVHMKEFMSGRDNTSKHSK